jgi:mRNA interferase MazF
LKPGDVVVGILVGAHEMKVRSAIVIASATYLAERPDVLVGILTTKLPNPQGTTDHTLLDWRSAVRACIRAAFAI